MRRSLLVNFLHPNKVTIYVVGDNFKVLRNRVSVLRSQLRQSAVDITSVSAFAVKCVLREVGKEGVIGNNIRTPVPVAIPGIQRWIGPGVEAVVAAVAWVAIGSAITSPSVGSPSVRTRSSRPTDGSLWLFGENLTFSLVSLVPPG